MIRAIIFDMDGTLLDTLDDLAYAVNKVLHESGRTALPVSSFKMLVGSGARILIRKAFEKSTANGGITGRNCIDPDMEERLVARFGEIYGSSWHRRTRLYPGVGGLLEKLAGSGTRLAVLSNKPDAFTRSIADYFFPAGLFSLVVGQHEGWPIKPDPARAVDMCRQMAVDPSETAVVGDSGSDMETAVRGGMQPIGVLWGFRSLAELKANGAVEVFPDPDSLWQYLSDQIKAGDVL